jgi:C1A family cysteine protease/putative hemolysin
MRKFARFKTAILLTFSALLTMVMTTRSSQLPSILEPWGGFSSLASSTFLAHKISNPAAVYCTDMGYEYHVISDGAGGQMGSCSLPNGTSCSAWDFLEGNCGQAYSYCARQGLSERTVRDGQNPFSPDYAVCVDAQGKVVGNVTTLDGLDSKLNHCQSSGEPAIPTDGANSMHPQAPLILTPTDSLPASFDWRAATYKGVTGDWTSPVKDQAGCGSCWAFAAVGQTEAILNLAASDPSLDEDLSEEYLVSDCSSTGTCCGGWHSSALDFIRTQGIPDEACLPYVSGSCGCSGSCSTACSYRSNENCANSTCSQRCTGYSGRLSRIDAYGSVGSNPTVIKQALITYGPLSVAIDISNQDGSFNPQTGVYSCARNGSVNHSVVIVGYNDPGKYWIVKNSWGSTWNDHGYFKMGYGQCQIENYVYYAHAEALIMRTLSGYVRSGLGDGIAGVLMDGLPGNPTTDSNGFYSAQVYNIWSGTIRPRKAYYSFDPVNYDYFNISVDQIDQNFTGMAQVLLVDDDDNAPNVSSFYENALSTLGKPYDIWDISIKHSDPDETVLVKYYIVIWFTGAKSDSAGPDPTGEMDLAAFLERGGSLLISSQDYDKSRGLTTFMSDYLGILEVDGDDLQSSVTGTGSVFAGLGPYELDYPFANYSDGLTPTEDAEVGFLGDQGSTAIYRSDGKYHSVYLGFPFEALPSDAAREQVLHAFLEWSYHHNFMPFIVR